MIRPLENERGNGGMIIGITVLMLVVVLAALWYFWSVPTPTEIPTATSTENWTPVSIPAEATSTEATTTSDFKG